MIRIILGIILLAVICCETIGDSVTFRNLVRDKNYKMVEDHNSKMKTYEMKLHKRFAQKTFEEVQEMYLTLKIHLDRKISVATPPKSSTLLSKFYSNSQYVNWTKQGIVSPVTDQGWCGSCYAHTGVGDIQSSYRLRNINVSLSIQQIVDCSGNFENLGCWGGWMGQVFDYTIVNGLTTKETYPDRDITYSFALSGPCDKRRGQYKIRSFAYTSYRMYDCHSLTNIVKQRPVSIAVDANLPFIFYNTGIFSGCDPVAQISVNHAMLMVGFVQNKTENYWIARNSWGLEWGQYGYIRLDRNIEGGNQCQVCLAPHYSIL